MTFTPEELKALDVESSEVIDLEKFVPRGEIDPVYFNSPYYLYPDGPIAVDTLRVIGAAMAELGVVGVARLTLSRRERPVMVEPRGTGMALFTLRTAAEVRAAQFGSPEGDLDAEMVAIADAIIKQRTGKFDPSTHRDRYQEALQELIEAKMQGRALKARTVTRPTPVIDLMTALKTQPRAGVFGSQAQHPSHQAIRAGRIRSAPTGLAVARHRGSDTKSRGRDRHRARHRCRKAAEAGLMRALRADSTAAVIGAVSQSLTERARS